MSFPVDETHDPSRTSWVESANGHADFPVQNLPLGVFSPAAGDRRIGTAIGDSILDLRAASQAGLLPETVEKALAQPTLNSLFDASKADRLALRRRLSALLSDKANQGKVESHLHQAQACTLHLPATIGDYTDFYVGIHHATNVGRLFRPDNPLLPNYKYVPIGYHGRASSIRPSGVPVVRPKGQTKAPDAEAPSYGPSRRLDYELELGIWIGSGNGLGEPVPIAEAGDHVAGFCLLNDWSARDVQAWEYVPLGPFLAKNFQSTISTWVVTSEALAPFRIAQPSRPPEDPRPLDYLWNDADQVSGALGIDMTVSLLTQRMRDAGLPAYRLSQGPASNMYWTVAQIIAHHTSNGCNLSPGDLLGTGTISAPQRDGYGSLLEISRGGAEPLILPSGETRTFVEDGDEVIMTGRAQAEGRVSIGFGPCRAVVLPAR
ncbi:MAG TPA: fumarylacetoacetase [Caulobacteraceae bacterium]|jgi:fumarylacetoacetase|nr:fumarylacetoacetase [Caulobacteraceae bacterium]